MQAAPPHPVFPFAHPKRKQLTLHAGHKFRLAQMPRHLLCPPTSAHLVGSATLWCAYDAPHTNPTKSGTDSAGAAASNIMRYNEPPESPCTMHRPLPCGRTCRAGPRCLAPSWSGCGVSANDQQGMQPSAPSLVRLRIEASNPLHIEPTVRDDGLSSSKSP